MEKIKIVLIEDDKIEWDKFKEVESNRDDIEGLEVVENNNIDVVILDLELNKGSGNGDGFCFLENLKKLNLKNPPKVIVTTNVMSDSIYDFLHQNGVDLIFYKKQNNYSQENIINKIVILNGYKNNFDNNIGIPKVENKNNKVTNKIEKDINKELDLIGVPIHMKGRKYLFEAIKFIITQGEETDISIRKHLFSVFKVPESTINRDMENAITRAWNTSSIDDLERLYTLKVDYRRGVPTINEFIYYYARKVKDNL